MGRKSERDFDARANRERTVHVKEHSSCADILCLGSEFSHFHAVRVDGGRQSHVKAPTAAALRRGWRHHRGIFSQVHKIPRSSTHVSCVLKNVWKQIYVLAAALQQLN